MKTELTKLILLAQIDAEIDQLLEKRESLPLRVTEIEAQVQELDQSLEHKRKEAASLKNELHQKTSTLSEQKEWIAQREIKVKEIKTIKEYQAALKEVAKSKKELSELESGINSLNTRLGEETKTTGEFESTSTPQRETLLGEIAQNREEISQIDTLIQQKQSEKTEKEKDLMEATLKKYQQIKKRISPAVSLASENGVCQECNVNIPPQLFIELQKFQQIISCPRCYRILYIEG